MKINFLTASMVGGGTERVIALLANYLVEQGHKVTIMMLADNRVEYSLNEKIEILQISSATGGRIKERIKRIAKLRSYFSKNCNDIYLSFGTETNLFAIVASAFFRCKLILSERNDPNQCNFKKFRDFLYFYGKYFVFQTEDARKCFSQKIQKRSVVIPNPLSEMLPEPFEGIREKTVVAVGRLEEQKNYYLLLDAFEKFSKVNKEYSLHIYGKGILLQDLELYAKKLEIEEKVKFEGFKKNVLEHIKNAGMYVLSSDHEGIPNAMLEAMAMGLPVIATDCPIGGPRMLLESEKNGILVPMNDSEAMSVAMKQIADDQDLAEKCSLEARKVRELYSIPNICDKWMEVIGYFKIKEK